MRSNRKVGRHALCWFEGLHFKWNVWVCSLTPQVSPRATCGWSLHSFRLNTVSFWPCWARWIKISTRQKKSVNYERGLRIVIDAHNELVDFSLRKHRIRHRWFPWMVFGVGLEFRRRTRYQVFCSSSFFTTRVGVSLHYHEPHDTFKHHGQWQILQPKTFYSTF